MISKIFKFVMNLWIVSPCYVMYPKSKRKLQIEVLHNCTIEVTHNCLLIYDLTTTFYGRVKFLALNLNGLLMDDY